MKGFHVRTQIWVLTSSLSSSSWLGTLFGWTTQLPTINSQLSQLSPFWFPFLFLSIFTVFFSSQPNHCSTFNFISLFLSSVYLTLMMMIWLNQKPLLHLSLLLLVLFSSSTESLRFELQSGHTKCISEDIKSNSMTVGKYTVINPNEGSPLPDSHKVTVRV